MASISPKKYRRKGLLTTCGVLSAIVFPISGWSQVASESNALKITVNSVADGAAQPDDELTLREAIKVINGTLSVSDLSLAEQQLVSSAVSTSTIQFNLPSDQTAIELFSVLPAIARPVVVDGTTQPGYSGLSATAEIDVPIPVVVLRPAPEADVFRGLTIAADDVVVRGLNLYGFNASDRVTQSTPPADIFISHKTIPTNREAAVPVANAISKQPPSGVVIEQNWLGLTVDEKMPAQPSGFGVSIFDSVGTTIRRNRIEYHNGSAIITGRAASNLSVTENIIVGNGLSGMPDAIRLDGRVENGSISDNLICGNDGSGIFLFKPEGAVSIANNDIRFNGQRLRRAAVYVMGENHQVLNNKITNQRGSGVVVTAYGRGPNTQSRNNIVKGNQFDNLEGLSIDLNGRRSHEPQNFRQGDGINPRRNSHNRRQDTGNGAVDAPQFVSPEFFVIDGNAVVQGRADAGSEIQLYRSTGDVGEYGPLSEPIETAIADEKGDFEIVVDAIGGEVLSAIATDSQYGTSEPARNIALRSLTGLSTVTPVDKAALMPQCTTPPVPASPPAPPTPPTALISPPTPVPESIQIEAPRNVHFGLDEDFISTESAAVLERLVTVLEDYPSIIINLHGHTDSRASVAYNQDLARRRAENTRRYLLSKGIGAERMTIRSVGETDLLVEETDRTNYARNRRVEFVFQDVLGADITFFDQENDLQIEP